MKSLNEAAYSDKVVKKFKVGTTKKYDAQIIKSGSKFVAVVDGDKLDEFNSQIDAEKAIKEFIQLIGK